MSANPPDPAPDPAPDPIPWHAWLVFLLIALACGLLVYHLPGWGA